MKRFELVTAAAGIFLVGFSAATPSGLAGSASLKLGSAQAFAGDPVTVGYTIVDKTAFGITLENSDTKERTHLDANNYEWNGSRLSIKLPANLAAGNYTVSLIQNDNPVAQSVLAVKVHATVTSSNLEGVLPGQPVIIYGTGFSPNANENLVIFNTTNGTVNSVGGTRNYDGPTGAYQAVPTMATPTSLTVVAPQEVANFVNYQVSAPTQVTVSVNGVPAAGSVRIFLSTRPWERGPQSIQVGQ